MTLKNVIAKLKELGPIEIPNVNKGDPGGQNLARVRRCFYSEFDDLGLENSNLYNLRNNGVKKDGTIKTPSDCCNIYYDGVKICSIGYSSSPASIATSYDDEQRLRTYGEYELQEAVNRIYNDEHSASIEGINRKIAALEKVREKLKAEMRVLPSELAM